MRKPMEDREITLDEMRAIRNKVGRYHCLTPARIVLARTIKAPLTEAFRARLLAAYELARQCAIRNYREIMRQDPLPDESLIKLVMMGECTAEEIGL